MQYIQYWYVPIAFKFGLYVVTSSCCDALCTAVMHFVLCDALCTDQSCLTGRGWSWGIEANICYKSTHTNIKSCVMHCGILGICCESSGTTCNFRL